MGEPELAKFVSDRSCNEGPLPADYSPLFKYLEQSACIALNVKETKELRTLTFPDPGSNADDRCVSMRLACEQARIREQSAIACKLPAINVLPPLSLGGLAGMRPILPPQLLQQRTQ